MTVEYYGVDDLEELKIAPICNKKEDTSKGLKSITLTMRQAKNKGDLATLIDSSFRAKMN
jgi:hypothetical protein